MLETTVVGLHRSYVLFLDWRIQILGFKCVRSKLDELQFILTVILSLNSLNL